MKKNTVIKRYFALALSLFMVLSLAAPVFADGDGYTVTIKTDSKFVSKPTDSGIPDEPENIRETLETRYRAYQIFSGAVSADYDKEPNGYHNMENIEWGSAVAEAGELLDAICEAGLQDVKADSAADIVASALAQCDSATLRDVAKAVAAKDEDGNYLYLMEDGYKKSIWTEDQWEIRGLEAGYYLIRDEYTEGNTWGESGKSNPGRANSEFIMAVFGNSEITPKAYGPETDKNIVSGDMEKKGDSLEIGQTVSYRLKGTLPENYCTAYKTYKYVFTDTMSAGLDYLGKGEDSVKIDELHDVKLPYVYVVIGGTIQPVVYSPDGVTGYGLEFSKTVDNETVMKVIFNDMARIGKEIKEVYVEYDARLNKNAVTTRTGNGNTLELEYSNDPNGSPDTTGKTTPDTPVGGGGGNPTIYDFGIEITKVNGANNNPLANVGFALKKDNFYAVAMSDGEGSYYLDGWSAEYSTMMTGTDGCLRIKGLAGGITYKLEEVSPLAAFDPIDDIDIRFDPVYNGSELQSLTCTTSLTGTQDITGDNLIAAIKVPNMPSEYLPGTGGRGVYLFYISGSTLLVGAALYLIYTNVKDKKKNTSDT